MIFIIATVIVIIVFITISPGIKNCGVANLDMSVWHVCWLACVLCCVMCCRNGLVFCYNVL